MARMEWVIPVMGTHGSFICRCYFTHILGSKNLHFSMGFWGIQKVLGLSFGCPLELLESSSSMPPESKFFKKKKRLPNGWFNQW